MYTMVVLEDEIVILDSDNAVTFRLRRDDFAHALELFANLHQQA